MARLIDRLTESKLRTLTEPGLYPDGRGLYVQVRPGGARSWIYRFTLNRRTRDMGLGSLLDVSLVRARAKAAECRALCARGLDPIEHERKSRTSAATAVSGPTFEEFAEACVEGWSADWKNEKHAAQWRSTLQTYVYPVIGHMPVGAPTTQHVLQILRPLWREKSETMSRVRGRMERVFAAASVEGYRSDNPAVWKGHLSEASGLGKKRRAVPFAGLPYSSIPAFMQSLREREGVSARALEFLILTVARTTEVLEARWSEIDEAQRVWRVPAGRMKADRPHEVPLSDRAMAILQEMKPLRDLSEGYIFPGQKIGRPLCSNVFLKLLERMDYGVTGHGFRSSFKTWAEEETDYARSVIEAAQAHIVRDKTERSYMRGTWFKKRRKLVEEWSLYCTSTPPAADIIQLRAS